MILKQFPKLQVRFIAGNQFTKSCCQTQLLYLTNLQDKLYRVSLLGQFHLRLKLKAAFELFWLTSNRCLKYLGRSENYNRNFCIIGLSSGNFSFGDSKTQSSIS